MKVHDAYTSNDKNIPLFPEEATAGAIYFIRNPLDVVISFAHHSGWDYDTAISRMADEGFAFCNKPKRLHAQLHQRLLSWSGHVKSWSEQAPFPVCVLRYEELNESQSKRIIDHHRTVMQRFGYLSTNDEIVF